MCLKELEKIRWRLINGEFVDWDEILTGKINYLKDRPQEFYLINEFPFQSAFCYMFRGYQIRNKKIVQVGPPYSEFNCLCPLWPKGKSCYVKGQTNKFMVEKIDSIPIENIMKILKKMPLHREMVKIRHLSGIWNIHLQPQLTAKITTDSTLPLKADIDF